MAIYESYRSVPGQDLLPKTWVRAIAAVIEWHEARLTRQALSKLTPEILDDIGLSRGDIERFS